MRKIYFDEFQMKELEKNQSYTCEEQDHCLSSRL